MNLAELTAAVYTETNRPDLVPETLQAILEATLSVHSMEEFEKDIREGMVVFDNPSLYIQTLDTSSMPRMKKVVYIRKTNPSVTVYEQTNQVLPWNLTYPGRQFNFLEKVELGRAIADQYGYEKQDIWYTAGSQLNIKSSTPLQYAMIGYLQRPNLDATGLTYESWIAQDWPYAIVYRAAGAVFAKIGEDKSFAIYMQKPAAGGGMDSGGFFYQQFSLIQQNEIII